MTHAARSLYLDLLKRCLVNLIYEDPAVRFTDATSKVSGAVLWARTRATGASLQMAAPSTTIAATRISVPPVRSRRGFYWEN